MLTYQVVCILSGEAAGYTVEQLASMQVWRVVVTDSLKCNVGNQVYPQSGYFTLAEAQAELTAMLLAIGANSTEV